MHKLIIIVEGDVDKVIFAELLKILKYNQYQILIGSEGVEDPSAKGRDAVINSLKDHINNKIFRDIYLALDLDNKSEKQLFTYVEKRCSGIMHPVAAGSYQAGETRIRIIPIGLRNDKTLKKWSISKNQAEDYLFKLILEKDIFNHLHKKFPACIKKNLNYEKALYKMKEMQNLLSKQNLIADNSKIYLEFFAAISAWIVSPATLTKKIFAHCSDELIRTTFQNILSRLND
ncbi:MAG: hypothetical protein A2Y62_10365 [Candidatus Fischerbacteria bacterium RBG_13_37_8]|uniref:DUF4276 family protein n=1 Tax=Candidatus Fischerbacteria bacterium RBG_13_37_8 TaxID=1817863 RepID=A0A1F5VQR6_9BACT|nr:MAG: hypothetical protein A2Y62_10365 [Candidatus Fischerbacteria bacterium RBG_13_37_8]